MKIKKLTYKRIPFYLKKSLKNMFFLMIKFAETKNIPTFAPQSQESKFSFNPGEMGEWLKPTVC